MRSEVFFDIHPVFTLQEYHDARSSAGRSPSTTKNLLAKRVAAGRIVRVRRGLYASVPLGVDPARVSADPYLVASKLADDAVVAYHAALQFHGKAYSLWRRFHYVTGRRLRPFAFRGDEYLPVSVPSPLRSQSDGGGAIETLAHGGGQVRVTTLERSMVDALDSPSRCGGWEEVWRSLEMIEFFDLDAVIEYAVRLDSAVTTARVGFFLEQHRDELMVDDAHLMALRRARPRQPRYFDSSRRRGRLIHDWNLIVPDEIAHRRWEEST